MSPETNKAIVRHMLEKVWNERRPDLIEEFYTENVIYHLVGMSSKTGTESVRKTVGTVLDAYPDLQYTIDDEIAEGDKVVSRWTMNGMLHGEMIDIPASGKDVIQSGVTIFHLSNARIDEFWFLSDNPEWIQQLGIVPRDGA